MYDVFFSANAGVLLTYLKKIVPGKLDIYNSNTLEMCIFGRVVGRLAMIWHNSKWQKQRKLAIRFYSRELEKVCNRRNYLSGCIFGSTDVAAECGGSESGSHSGLVCCFHLYTKKSLWVTLISTNYLLLPCRLQSSVDWTLDLGNKQHKRNKWREGNKKARH